MSRNGNIYLVAGLGALAAAAYLIMNKNKTTAAQPANQSSSGGSSSSSTTYQGGAGTYPNHNYTTRGYRNNNPLNMDYVAKNTWVGQIVPSGDSRFCQFYEMKYGYRATFKNLYTYINKYGWNTIRKICSHWAPMEENRTDNYIANVASWSGLGADVVLTATDTRLKKVVAAMSKMENGQDIAVPQGDLETGWNLYIQSI